MLDPTIKRYPISKGKGKAPARLYDGAILDLKSSLIPTRDTQRAQKEPCVPEPRRKKQRPHKRLSRTCLWVSGSLRWRNGSVVACCRVGGTECSSACIEHFEGGPHYFHYLHHSLASGQIRGREHSPTLQQKIKLKIY